MKIECTFLILYWLIKLTLQYHSAYFIFLSFSCQVTEKKDIFSKRKFLVSINRTVFLSALFGWNLRILLWSFSFDWTIVYCWRVFLIDRIRTHWYWNLSLGVLENFLWAISKPEIHVCLPWRLEEGCGEGTSWVFILVHVNFVLAGLKYTSSS